MRLSLTDQFLWEIYNFFEKTGELLEPPEIFKVQSFKQALSSPEQKKFWKEIEKRKKKRQFAQFINHLKKRGYIKIVAKGEKKGILLTPKTKEKILKIKTKLKDKKQRKDKKWIMLMYDIPKRKTRQSVLLRAVLKNLGYQQFQKSIWVCPYDVLEETREATSIYYLDPYIKIFLIEEILL